MFATGSPKRRSVTALCVVALAAAGLSCAELADPVTPAGDGTPSLESAGLTLFLSNVGPSWVWVMRIDGGRYADHVQLLQFLRTDRLSTQLRLRVLPSRDWAGQPTTDLQLDADTAGMPVAGELRAQLSLRGGSRARLVMRVQGERALGRWDEVTVSGDTESYRVVAYRVPLSVLPPDPAKLTRMGTGAGDSLPLVLLRVDDNMPSDRDFAQRLIDRQLPAEFAIPTFSPGNLNRPSWTELTAWSQQGITMVAHSRRHSYETAGDLDFMEEVLGSMADLRAHGLSTTVFVQPGSWRDSLYFDSPQKVETWRGALLRTASLVSECYDSPGTLDSPLNESFELCYSHVTISDNLTVPQILAAWQVARQPHRFTTFLVHSYRMPTIDFLDFFLDSLKTARAAGRIRIAHASVDAFFRRENGTTKCAPAPPPAGVTTEDSVQVVLGNVPCASGQP